MEAANALAFRLDAPAVALRARVAKDGRIRNVEIEKARWFSFELSSDADLHAALDWLAKAHEAAGKNKKSR